MEDKYIKFLEDNIDVENNIDVEDNINKKEFCFKCDKGTLTSYGDTKSGKDEDYKYHLEVLPQPYFGNIIKPKVLILGKNPSYEDGTHNKEYFNNNDNTDTIAFNKSNKTLKDYIYNLKNVDFFKPENDDNKYFVNCAWHWWYKKVFGENNNFDNFNDNVGIINLCPYHSKRYNEIKANQFTERENALRTQIKSILSDRCELIIIVWGYNVWKKFMNSDNELSDLFTNTNKIILNQLKNPTKKGCLYGQNIQSINTIINKDNDRYDKDAYNKMKEIFKNQLKD